MTDNVVDLFGGEQKQEEEKELSAKEVLHKYIEEVDFENILAIGVDADGTVSAATNLTTTAQAVFLLEKFKLALIDLGD